MKSYSSLFLILAVALIALTVDNVNADSDCQCIFNHSKTMFESIEKVSLSNHDTDGPFLTNYKNSYSNPTFNSDVKNLEDYTKSILVLYMETFVKNSDEQSDDGSSDTEENPASKVIKIVLEFCTNIKNDTQNCTERVREPIFLLKELHKLYHDLTGGGDAMAEFEEKCGKYPPKK